jgi:DNA replication protein DnaC
VAGSGRPRVRRIGGLGLQGQALRRSGRRSTALATNIEFKAWGDYLGDPPLATAFLDRLVDGAVILKLTGRSYRAARARPVPEADDADRT